MKEPKSEFTTIPNIFFDEWLPNATPAECKILLVVLRKTVGWHKEEEVITFSEFVQLTGMPLRTVRRGIASAIEHGYLIQTRRNAKSISRYKLVDYVQIGHSTVQEGHSILSPNDDDYVLEGHSTIAAEDIDGPETMSREDTAIYKTKRFKKRVNKNGNNTIEKIDKEIRKLKGDNQEIAIELRNMFLEYSQRIDYHKFTTYLNALGAESPELILSAIKRAKGLKLDYCPSVPQIREQSKWIEFDKQIKESERSS